MGLGRHRRLRRGRVLFGDEVSNDAGGPSARWLGGGVLGGGRGERRDGAIAMLDGLERRHSLAILWLQHRCNGSQKLSQRGAKLVLVLLARKFLVGIHAF